MMLTLNLADVTKELQIRDFQAFLGPDSQILFNFISDLSITDTTHFKNHLNRYQMRDTIDIK